MASKFFSSHCAKMKKIFLTGASSGIGRATAEALLARSHEVWGTSRDPGRLLSGNGKLHPVRLDLSDPSSIQDGFKTALAEAGHFDVVINNAGGGHFGPGEALSNDELAAQFQILFFGHVDLFRRALEAMRRSNRGGVIINVTSLAAELPVPYMAAYNAAKAAMASFTMTMQLELSGSNIRLVDLQPADINTGFNDAVMHHGAAAPQVEKIWRQTDRNMKAAPPPEFVGRRIVELVESDDLPPRLLVGNFFQSKLAPVLYQLLPQRVRLWGLRKYYGI